MDTVKFLAPAFSFGRNSAMSDVILDHPSISRQHAFIASDDAGTVYVVDNNSTHGTFVNGKRIEPKERIEIHETDVLTLGGSTREYKVKLSSRKGIETEDFPQNTAQVSNIAANRRDFPSTREEREAELAAMIASVSKPVEYVPKYPRVEDTGDGLHDIGSPSESLPEFLPISFGAKKGGSDAYSSSITDQYEDEEPQEDPFEPRYTPDESHSTATLNAVSTTTTSLSDQAHELGLPLSHEALLAPHAKAVHAVTVDPAGSRVVTGGADYLLKFYDFGGMDTQHKPFREFVPLDGQPVLYAVFSPAGDKVGVITPGLQARVFDRDGRALATTIKGDMYLKDPSGTKGHQTSCTRIGFFSKQRDLFWTASMDGTVRTWDLANGRRIFDELCCQDILRFRTPSGQKSGVTSAVLSPDETRVFALCEDGSIHMVRLRNPGYRYARTDMTIPNAHAPSSFSHISVSANGKFLATRSGDDTVKIWNAETLARTPLLTIEKVATGVYSNVVFSPDSTKVVLGTTLLSKNEGNGKVLVFAVPETPNAPANAPNRVTEAHALYGAAAVPNASATFVLWHEKINQILVGGSDGYVRVFYSPQLSVRGALVSSSRAPKKREIGALDFVPSEGSIIAPFAQQGPRDKKRGRDASYPEKPSTLPEFITNPNLTLSDHYLQSNPSRSNLREQDPQKILQAYAERTKDSVFTKAYEKNQPKPLLHSLTLEEELELERARKTARKIDQ